MDLQLPVQSVSITTQVVSSNPVHGQVYLIISERLWFSMICYKVSQWLATGRWFSHDTPVSSTNKTDRLDIIKILLKVALNTINQPTNHNKTCDKHTYVWLEEWNVFNIRYLSRRGQWGHPTQLWKVHNCILNMEAKNKRKWFMVYFEAELLYFALTALKTLDLFPHFVPLVRLCKACDLKSTHGEVYLIRVEGLWFSINGPLHYNWNNYQWKIG